MGLRRVVPGACGLPRTSWSPPDPPEPLESGLEVAESLEHSREYRPLSISIRSIKKTHHSVALFELYPLVPGTTIHRGHLVAALAGKPPEKVGKKSTSRTLSIYLYLVLLGSNRPVDRERPVDPTRQ